MLKQVKAKCRFQEAYSQLSTEKEISLSFLENHSQTNSWCHQPSEFFKQLTTLEIYTPNLVITNQNLDCKYSVEDMCFEQLQLKWVSMQEGRKEALP
jgi:hypothetical protein